MSSTVAKAARRVTHELHGVVVSAGLMDKTVKVRVGGQKWNKIVNKVRPQLTGFRADMAIICTLLNVARLAVVCRPEALPRP